ncbi:MAG TPA: BTAD domain-containing putative transcriptional regulator [Streptosporangiaceae bacterium]
MSARAPRGARWVAWSLFGLALALFAGFAVLSAAGSSAQGPQAGAVDVLVFVLLLAYAAVGALVSSRLPENPIGWLFLCQGLLFEFTAFSLGYVKHGLFARPGSLPAAPVMAWVGQWIWIPEFFTLPALFFLLFPHGRLRSNRWRVVVWLIAGVSLAGFISSALAPGSLGGSLSSVPNPFGIAGAQPALRLLGSVATGAGGPAFLAALASFILRFRGSQGAERHQLKWLLYAAVLLVLSFGVGDLLQALGLPGSVTSNFWVVPVALVPVAAGIAVLGYRLYDIDFLISKTLVFGIVAAFATAVYAAMVAGVGAAVGSSTGWNAGLAVTATAVAAVAFQPVRERVHRRVRRMVFGPPTVAELKAGVSIGCLGAFRVFRDGAPLSASAWQSKKARTLLKILVARRGRSTTRDLLMEALWPEEDVERLANRLSVALTTVRAVLDPAKRYPPDHFLAGDKDAVRLNLANLPVDVEAFMALAERGLALDRAGRGVEAESLLREAEAAYAGDFLEEDLYEDWAAALREEARSTYVSVARVLARRAAAAADHDSAARYYLRILEKDGWDEGAHLGLVEALERAGRRGDARRRYRAYVSRMEEIEVPVTAFPASERIAPQAP